MKNLAIYPAIICFLFVITSCTNQSEEATELNQSSAERLVQDPQYAVYRTEELNNQRNIVEGNYDLTAIGDIILAHQNSICDVPDKLLTDVRGGILYRDIHCKLYNALVYIKNTYPEYETYDKSKLLESYKKYHHEYVEQMALVGLTPKQNID